MKFLVTILVGFVVVQPGVISQSQSCPVFGTNRQPTSRSTQERLFMNFDAPSQCNGTVTSWNYCYYRPNRRADDDILGVKFLVYRQNTSTSLFHPVPNSVFTLTVNYGSLNVSGCQSVMLNSSQQFQIQMNDVISACIIDCQNLHPLYVTTLDYFPDFNYQVDSSEYERCTDQQLDTIDTTRLRIRRRNMLLLHATISRESAHRVGNNPTPSSYSGGEGTYLNINFPAECDGVVTAWHYCYYPGSASANQRTYTASVALWHYDNSSNQYYVVDGSVTLIELQPVDTLARIFCTQVLLAPANYTEIRRGDVVGVLLPSSNPIPLIGRDEDNTLLRNNIGRSSPSNVSSDQLVQQSLAIHLYADIMLPDVTSLAIPTTSPSTMAPFSIGRNTTSPPTGGLTSGGVAGVVIFCLLVILLLAASAVVILVIAWKKKWIKYNFKKSSETEHVGPSFDNLNYTGTTLASSYETPVSRGMSPSMTALVRSSSVQYEPINYRSASYVSEVEMSQYSDPLEQSKTHDIYAGLQQYQEPAGEEGQLYSQIQTQAHVVMDIDRQDIQVIKFIGSGEFGSVDEGRWKRNSQEEVPVALKTLKHGSSERDKVRFLQEAVIMSQFRHPNIVLMLGMVTDQEPIILVIELAEGDLRKYLLEMCPDPGQLVEPETPELLLQFSQQVALGMHYLSSKGFVHRDLAARNVLLSPDNNCKITDFGLSRDLEDENYYMSSGGLIPVKWTAPEAIRFKKYSTASDVWSYGCLLYEIWSLGHKPFEDHRNMEIISIVESGKRLAPPSGCPRKIYSFMIKCWNLKKSLRPNFRDAILALTIKKQDVLEIPQESLDTNPQFKHLGGPLEVGQQIYMDLQTTYK